MSKYFGPYSDVTALRETVKLLTGLFPIRTCRKLRQRERPCLNQHIERCLAPCVGGVEPETYREMVEAIIRFLEGDHGHLLKEMEQEMKEAAQNLEFEKAARLRDTMQAVERWPKSRRWFWRLRWNWIL